jgi:hypothetical protein
MHMMQNPYHACARVQLVQFTTRTHMHMDGHVHIGVVCVFGKVDRLSRVAPINLIKCYTLS